MYVKNDQTGLNWTDQSGDHVIQALGNTLFSPAATGEDMAPKEVLNLNAYKPSAFCFEPTDVQCTSSCLKL